MLLECGGFLFHNQLLLLLLVLLFSKRFSFCYLRPGHLSTRSSCPNWRTPRWSWFRVTNFSTSNSGSAGWRRPGWRRPRFRRSSPEMRCTFRPPSPEKGSILPGGSRTGGATAWSTGRRSRGPGLKTFWIFLKKWVAKWKKKEMGPLR